MQPNLITAGPLDDAIDVAYLVVDNGLNAMPVVTTEQRLLGIVTVAAAMRQLLPEGWRERFPGLFS
jgi:CBS domain-containing protein